MATEAPSILEYGGFKFRIERVTLWDTRPVYCDDGSERLYLHHRIGIQAVWNPYATRSGNVVPGPNALVSIANVREQVLAPRQLLKVTIGGEVVLQSPQTKNLAGDLYPCDARNGPNPLALNVIRITGIGTVIAYFEIETWVPALCPDNQLAVLTHRWTMAHELDEHFMTTRIITGQATFRTDFLINFGWVPDDFRARLFHPVPDNFRREHISVSATADGSTVQYRLQDREQPVNMLNGPRSYITKIKGTWKVGFHSANLLEPAYRYVNMSVQLWGKRNAPRFALIHNALVAVAGFGFTDLQKSPLFHKADLAVDLIDKYVQLDAGLILDGYISNWANMVIGNDPFSPVLKLFQQNEFPDDIPGLTTSADRQNPRPLTDFNGSRQTFTEKLVHQALLDPCGTPVEPSARPRRAGVSILF